MKGAPLTEKLYLWSGVALFVVGIFSAQEYSSIPYPGALYLPTQAIILIIFFYARRCFFDNNQKKYFFPISIYLSWNTFQIIRGFTVAENYWDWKGLMTNGFALILPILAYSTCNEFFMQRIMNFWIKFSFPISIPLFLIFSSVVYKESYGFYYVPISILIFFLPATPYPWKIIFPLTALCVIASDLDGRSNVIKLGIPLALITYFPLRKYIPREFLRFAHAIFLILPIILFTLGVTGTFNIFKMDEYIDSEASVQVKRADANEAEAADLKADTRTFLYEEVLTSAQKYDYWWLGRTPARGNESATFGLIILDPTGRGERLANEAGVLNVFTWTGIIGLLLYFWVFAHASYLAIYRSNNTYIKLIGFFISFHWLYSWVENFTNFTLPYILIWMMIGVCLSDAFRRKTDTEVASWVDAMYRRNPFSKTPTPESIR